MTDPPAVNIPTCLRQLDALLAEHRVEEAREKVKQLERLFRTFCDLLTTVTEDDTKKG